MAAFTAWLETGNIIVIGGVLALLMALAAQGGHMLRVHHDRLRNKRDRTPVGIGGQEGYVTSAVLGLLALLLGFTFSLAVNRFETRRVLVISEANAIGTAYLRTQLLPEPHRARITVLLKTYTDNRIKIATAGPVAVLTMIPANDRLLTDLWTATVAAVPAIEPPPFANLYVDSINRIIDLDEERKSSRQANVPPVVFAVLFVYITVTSGSLGYSVTGVRGMVAASVLLFLILMTLLLTIDIDRPTGGAILENQAPMRRLQRSMATIPPATFDRWIDTSTAATP